MDSEVHADDANKLFADSACEFAVSHYGLVTSKAALADAVSAGVDVSGKGPFLLAWSPAVKKGDRDAIVLVSDLSQISTSEHAEEVFRDWVRDIESDPNLWNKGWNLDKLRRKIQLWVDKYGTKILSLYQSK